MAWLGLLLNKNPPCCAQKENKRWLLERHEESFASSVDLPKLLSTQPEGQIVLEGGNKKNQLDFAAKAYEQIQNGNSLYLLKGDEKLELLNDSKSREAFRVTMFDYFRLTLAY